MAKILPKRVLDEAMLKEMCKYYRTSPSNFELEVDEVLEWECFSQPGLQYHDCNIRATLLGDHVCTKCNHESGTTCVNSCDVQVFCLAVYAWRIGVGGPDFKEALHHNLRDLTPDELYSEVIKTMSLEDMDFDLLAGDPGSIPEPEEEGEEEVKDEGGKLAEYLEDPDNYLTIKEAADYYQCTYSNIYNYVVSGKLDHIELDGRKKVSKTVLDKFMTSRKGKRGRKASL